jgi:hypothetical protein
MDDEGLSLYPDWIVPGSPYTCLLHVCFYCVSHPWMDARKPADEQGHTFHLPDGWMPVPGLRRWLTQAKEMSQPWTGSGYLLDRDVRRQEASGHRALSRLIARGLA